LIARPDPELLTLNWSYSALVKVLQHIDYRLMLWATHKYKRLKGRPQKAKIWLNEVINRDPTLFVHWTQMYANG